MKLLLTGFEPFGKSSINPSECVVRAIAENPPADIDLHTAILPVDTTTAPNAITEHIDQTSPDAVLCLGESGSALGVTLERIAINLLDFKIPDNNGVLRNDQPINPDAPAAYFNTAPLDACRTALIEAQIPVFMSRDCGSYLCNQITFTALHHLATTGRPHTPAAFVHLPRLPHQVAALVARGGRPTPSMPLDISTAAVRLILRTFAESVRTTN